MVPNDDEFAYNNFIAKYPSIILDYRLLSELSRCFHTLNTQPGEIQIKDKIPIEYFVGVALPNINLEFQLKQIQPNPNYHNYHSHVTEELATLSEEEFISRYYQDVILFERVLVDTGSHLKLYYTETGLPILSSQNMAETISKMKKKYK